MTEVEREKRIKEYLAKFNKMCEGLPADSIKLAMPLIERVAFMLTSLEEMENGVKTEGTIIEYQNGKNQWGKQVNPSLKIYTPLIKVCSTVYKQVVDIVMKDAPANIVDEKLDGFRQGLKS